MFLVKLVSGKMPTYLPAPQGQQIGVCPCVQGAGATLKTPGHSIIPTLGSQDERWRGAEDQGVPGASVEGGCDHALLLPPRQWRRWESLSPLRTLGRSWGGVVGCSDSPHADSPPALAERAHCERCTALSECWHPAMAPGGSVGQSLGLDRGQLMQLSFHSLQLHVPREVPEAREDPLYGCGPQPGPSAYAVWAEGLGKLALAAGPGLRGWLLGWGGSVPLCCSGSPGC